MQESIIINKALSDWMQEYPLLQDIISLRQVWWSNPVCAETTQAISLKMGINEVQDAELRLQRFASYIAKAFPETQQTKGIIESPLLAVPAMQEQ